MNSNANDSLTLGNTVKMEDMVIDMRLVFVGHGHVQDGRVGWKGDHDFQYRSYVLLPGAYLNDAVLFTYGNSLRPMQKKTRWQRIDLYSDDEEPSDVNADRPVNEKGHTSEGGIKESHICDLDLSTAGVEIHEDY